MTGLAYYAIEDFDECKKYWSKSLKSMKRMKESQPALISELLNNLGAVHFETGNEASALKLFQESLDLQRKIVISQIYDEGKRRSKPMLMKLAITQANVAYVHFRLKNADAAIAGFERSKQVRVLRSVRPQIIFLLSKLTDIFIINILSGL